MSLEREQILGIAAAEREALGRTIQYTPPEAWDADSRLNGWRNRDIVAHLAGSELAAAAVVGGEVPTELEDFLKTDEGATLTVDRFNEFTVERRRERPFREIAVEWGRAADVLLSRVSAIPPDDWESRRVAWVVGDIPVRFMLQGRVSEWWIHGEDIRAGAGLEPRKEHWPIYAVNDLAIRTLPWALGLAGLAFQGKSVRFDLEGAGGGTWHYGLAPREIPPEDKQPDALIEGRAHPLALVAARRVPADEYVADGTLVLSGDEDLALTVLQHIRAFA